MHVLLFLILLALLGLFWPFVRLVIGLSILAFGLLVALVLLVVLGTAMVSFPATVCTIVSIGMGIAIVAVIISDRRHDSSPVLEHYAELDRIKQLPRTSVP